MAAETPTPTCEVTKLPLPVFHAEPPQGALFVPTNFHHHFHPHYSPELENISGRAVRYSRGQTLPIWLHQNYHDIFTGPELPKKLEDKFRLTVLSCAGVVPRQAIDVSSDSGYDVIDLNNVQYELLASRSSIHIEEPTSQWRQLYVRKTIGKFFAAYAMKQDVEDIVSRRVIKEFLSPRTSEARKRELGSYIIRGTLEESVRPLVPFHHELQDEGYVQGSKTGKLKSVLRKFFTKNYFPDYHEEIARLLQRS